MAGMVPQTGQQGQVVLDGLNLQIVPGTYQVTEAERLAQKFTVGAIKYADFNPYEAPWEVVTLTGGYGLRRFSDKALDDPKRRSMYVEADDVDCRWDGMITLGPKHGTSVDLGGPIVWIGEYQPQAGPLLGFRLCFAIAGSTIWQIDWDVNLTPWNFTANYIAELPAQPLPQAVTVFGTKMIFGYGGSRTAQWTDDLVNFHDVTNLTPNPIYVWAVTADRAAAYVAGGPTGGSDSLDRARVVSSADGGTQYSTPTDAIQCGGSGGWDATITGLAPGGGIALLFVAKRTELGEIDANSIYRQLVPFDSGLDTNGVGMRWWMGTGGQAQRGPVVLFFPRDQSLWSYQPSTQDAGSAQNVSPWADNAVRPPNARGITTAIQGTARWLYYAVKNPLTGISYLLAQDARTANVHVLFSLGAYDCNAMGVSSVLQPNPVFLYGAGRRVGYFILPLDGNNPVDDPGVGFTISGKLTLPDIDLDLPDEQKILFTLRVAADNLTPGLRWIDLEASYDGGAWTSLDSVTYGPVQEISFPVGTSCKRVGLRLTLYSYDERTTPQLRGIVLRASVNAKLYRIWNFQAQMPVGSTAGRTEDLTESKKVLDQLWTDAANGIPVSFFDRWGDLWSVRILSLAEQEKIREPDRTPETTLALQLLQVSPIQINNRALYDSYALYDDDETYVGAYTADDFVGIPVPVPLDG